MYVLVFLQLLAKAQNIASNEKMAAPLAVDLSAAHSFALVHGDGDDEKTSQKRFMVWLMSCMG